MSMRQRSMKALYDKGFVRGAKYDQAAWEQSQDDKSEEPLVPVEVTPVTNPDLLADDAQKIN